MILGIVVTMVCFATVQQAIVVNSPLYCKYEGVQAIEVFTRDVFGGNRTITNSASKLALKVEDILVIVVLGYLSPLARIAASRLLSSRLSSPPDHGR